MAWSREVDQVKRVSHQLGPGLKPIIDYGVASSAPGGWDRQSVPAKFVDRDVYIADTEIATARKEQKHREKGARNMVAQQRWQERNRLPRWR
ncbi:hypothetical protein HaLaN_16194 [Haematococcus lacustris]|uniref:Uncharacterized protein n=1 Tax=Haematococcus lacustris TaxID=44745 RepID=A0A699ZKD5_HAELA|nr:hypothetical protein HaLaN_16194 [Haematococcus lacustris]